MGRLRELKVTSIMKLKDMEKTLQLVMVVVGRFDDEKQKMPRPRNQ